MKKNTLSTGTRVTGMVALVAASTLGFTLSPLKAQNVDFAPLAVKGGKASSSSFVFLDDKGTLATVVELGSDVTKASLTLEGKKVPLKFVVNDADSRIAIYQLPTGSPASQPAAIGASLQLKPSDKVFTSATDHSDPARVVGRVHRFQGKVLPLAVLRVNHSKAAPRPGSGVYDTDGKLVGLVRQAVYNAPNSSYCLPVEVITRVLNDHRRNGRVGRCWIGIVMDELVAAPIVESVRPDSPAKKAGLQNGDVILSIGDQAVGDYAGVVDAFYYLVAGETKKFRVLRGTEVKELDITPEVSPGR
ncbi:MAG: serine protease [Akkermansiaceae bacterium]|nr:serine protease [Akkermansiaceae bacterium]